MHGSNSSNLGEKGSEIDNLGEKNPGDGVDDDYCNIGVFISKEDQYTDCTLIHDDATLKTTIIDENGVKKEVDYKLKTLTKSEGKEEGRGTWQQNIYIVRDEHYVYQRCDKTLYERTKHVEEFKEKLPRPAYPTAPVDLTIYHVYTDKYHSKHDYYNDVLMSKGERFPKQLDQGHGWVFYIGNSFPRWNVSRTGGDRTTYYGWTGDVVDTSIGRIQLTW